ncbi:MAG: hypothetical protein GW859_07010, partial [Sphingomonadales bacterium]|nr:hypothetical protein [Sphingomonadales bacterium]
LFDELTIGNDARSLRDRLSSAQEAYNPLAERVAAGDMSAYDDYAVAARALLDIQRQFAGSQDDYFKVLDEITALTKARIDAETNITSISANRDSPFSNTGIGNDNGPVIDAIDRQTDAVIARLDALNRNFGNVTLREQAGMNMTMEQRDFRRGGFDDRMNF